MGVRQACPPCREKLPLGTETMFANGMELFLSMKKHTEERVAAFRLAVHRNLISSWQFRYFYWVMDAWVDQHKVIIGCRRIAGTWKNVMAYGPFNRWKGLVIAIHRGRELEAWRSSRPFSGRRARASHLSR